jgi:hypothetical protein
MKTQHGLARSGEKAGNAGQHRFRAGCLAGLPEKSMVACVHERELLRSGGIDDAPIGIEDRVVDGHQIGRLNQMGVLHEVDVDFFIPPGFGLLYGPADHLLQLIVVADGGLDGIFGRGGGLSGPGRCAAARKGQGNGHTDD